MKALFDFISKLLAALSRAAGDKAEEPDAPTPEKVSTVDTQSAAPHGWGGPLPYRYIDVSRYQGKIKMDGWAQVKASGYLGVMLRAVGSRNGVPYIDPTFEDNYANAKAAGLDVGVYYYTNASCEKLADEGTAGQGTDHAGGVGSGIAESCRDALWGLIQSGSLPSGTAREDGLLCPALHLHELRQRPSGHGKACRAVGRMAGGLHRQDPQG